MKTNKIALTLLVALLTAGTQAADSDAKESIQQKLERIVIPKLEFRDATIREAVDFLRRKSIEMDVDSPAAERGVNIALHLDPAATPAAGAPAAPVGDPYAARITVSRANVALVEALRTVTNLTNCKFKVEPYAVSIWPASVNTDELFTKEWKIRPDLIPHEPAEKDLAKSWLMAKGIQFDGGTSAIYVASGSKLILRNTQEQLDLVDKLVTTEAKK